MSDSSINSSRKGKKALAIIGCILVQICCGILYVWSVFRQPVIDHYGWEPGQVNLIASFMLFAFCFGNLLGGLLQDKKGPKICCFIGIGMFGGGMLLSSFIPAGASIVWFYFTYCIIAGIGSGLCYGPVLACLQKWFPDKRGFATGLGAGAFGMSTVVFAPVANSLIQATNAPRAIMILGIIFLAVGLASCFMISLPESNTVGTEGRAQAAAETSMTPLQAAKTWPFWLLFIGCFLYNGTWNMLSPIIKTLGINRGLTDTAATLCVSLTGIANAAGRLIMSSLSDKIGRVATLLILCGMTIISGIALIFSGGGFLFGIVLLTAFAYGGPAAVNPATSTDFFGPKYAGSNYGIIMLSLGFSSVLFNMLSNAMYRATGGYTLTFIAGAASAAISVVVYIVISKLRKKAN